MFSIILVSFIALGSFILAFLVLFNNRKNRLNKIFFIFAQVNTLWALVNLMTGLNPVDIWVRGMYGFGALLMASGLTWFFCLMDGKVSFGKYFFLYSTGLLFFILSLFSDSIIKRIDQIHFGYFDGEFGLLFPVYTLFVSCSLIYIVVKLFRSASVSVGSRKTQLTYVAIGALIFAFFTAVLSFILPILNILFFSQFDLLGSFIFLSIITYSIIKYRLMDIRFILTKSILYFILVLIVTSSFTFVTFLTGQFFEGKGQLWVTLLVSLVVVIFLDPLKHLLAKWTDKFFYKGKIDYQEISRLASWILAKEIDLGKLLNNLSLKLEIELKLKKVSILISSPEYKNEYRSLDIKERLILSAGGIVINYLNQHKEPIIIDELSRLKSIIDQKEEIIIIQQLEDRLEELNVAMVVPIFLEDKIVGVFLVKEKLSSSPFSQEDINFFQLLAPQAATALEKARLYKEVQEFNVSLQAKVDQATKELKQTNTELKEANFYLQRLDKAKSEFLSIASHQLRTPLTGIKGYLSMILEGDFGKVEPEVKKVVQEVYESSNRLTRLVNVFLNVSRIESGRFQVDKIKFSLTDLVEQVAKELNSAALRKNLILTFKKTKTKLPDIMADKDKIKDVLLNLVDNSIKYTPTGKIDVTVEKLEDNKLKVMVSDTGVGIDPEEATKLFAKFSRGDGIAQIDTTGSGLGLYIAKKIIEAHGGKIWAESDGKGKGSRFIFELPIE